MNVALIELYPSHDECMYSQIRFLKDSGYTVHVICLEKLKSRLQDIDAIDYYYYMQYGDDGWFNLKELMKVRQYLKKNNIKIAIFNTSRGSRIRNLLLMPHNRIHFVGIGHAANMMFSGFTSKFIRLKIKQYFVLNDYILPQIPHVKGVQVSSFYPIYFPPYKAIDIDKSPDEFWVCIPGGIDFQRKDYWGLFQSLIDNELDSRIRFIVLGNSNKTNELVQEFIQKLKVNNLEKYFIFFNGFVTRDNFYSYLSMSDIVLPLIHPSKDLYAPYIKVKISGTYNLAFGFNIPMLCEKAFSCIDDFEASSFFYEHDKLVIELNKLIDRKVEIRQKKDAIQMYPKFNYEFQRKKYLEFITSSPSGLEEVDCGSNEGLEKGSGCIQFDYLNMTKKINVVFASDDNYAQHMGIAIMSCLEKTACPERLKFYILANNISNKNREKLIKIIQSFSASYSFIEPDTQAYRDIPKVRYGVAALFRLSMDILLPEDVDKVIYLDCDILLFSDIAELWDMGLGGHIVGAVTNLGHQPLGRLGIENGEYFNSGVLFINVDKWRSEDIGNKIIKYMNNNIHSLLYPDQDGLNIILKNKWKHLPLRWNQQPASYSMYLKERYEKSLCYQDYFEAVTNPAIVHFLSHNKPWNYLSYHPLKEVYTEYLKRSPWADYKPEDYTAINIVKKWVSLEKNIKRLYRRYLTPEKIKFIR